MKKLMTIMAAAAMAITVGTVQADSYDQNVIPGVIFGDGNANGSFTTDTASGIELGLRGKLRYNASGAPENTFNSNGDGSYDFEAGVAPTQTSPTGVWSFEWTVNSNVDGSGANLDAYTYELGIDSDPTAGTNYTVFDVINGQNGGGDVFWDHAIGTNATTENDHSTAGSIAEYATLINTNNVAQNSWKATWFIAGFNPETIGTYSFYLAAFDGSGEVTRTDMDVNVVPEPASLGLLAVGAMALIRRKR